MLYKEDFEKTKQRYIEYWNKENHDRPIIWVTAPREGYVPKAILTQDRLVDKWTDTEYVIRSSRENFARTYFGGEAFPILCPNLGPDIFGAILGCGLEFGEETSWAKHIIENWEDVKEFKFDPENKWWKKIKDMTIQITDDACGDYFVGITDLHPGADGIVSLRGPENLCYDLLDHPGEVKKVNFELLEVYKTVLDELYKLTIKNQEGSTNWMGIWHWGKWYVASSDFSCMISSDMFDEFILPELKEEINYLDASMYHLDGPGALKHLDKLLQMQNLDGIQWVYSAGKPTAAYWISTLKKIQAAGKLIQVDIVPEDLDILLAELKLERVMYKVNCSCEDEAKNLIKKSLHY